MNYQKGKTGKIKKAIFISMAVLILSLFIIGSCFLDPVDIMDKMGSRNAWILAFVASFFAGFSAFTAVSFYSILFAFISGGMNPVILWLVAGSSLALGDSFFFHFGQRGRELIGGKLDRRIRKITLFFSQKSRSRHIPYLSYVYISFIPLPNDWLLIFLASIKFPARRLLPIIILGDLSHVGLLILLISNGVELIF